MINKFRDDIVAAVSGVKDGDTVLVGGFGAIGTPNMLVEALIHTGAKDLTIVTNNGGYSRDIGIPQLMLAGAVRKLICSFPMGGGVVNQLFGEGKLELEVVPQGTLAERIRAAGAGIPAFYTPTSVGTPIAAGKEHREFNGVTYVMEHALPGDIALVEAYSADRFGNLAYRGSGRNFNPVMATAGKITVAQVHVFAKDGEIEPNDVITPSAYVDHVVMVDQAARDSYANAKNVPPRRS